MIKYEYEYGDLHNLLGHSRDQSTEKKVGLKLKSIINVEMLCHSLKWQKRLYRSREWTRKMQFPLVILNPETKLDFLH